MDTPQPSSPRNTTRLYLAILGLVAVAIGGVLFYTMRTRLTGEFQGQGGSLGSSWSFRPDGCRSGQAFGEPFFGVELQDARTKNKLQIHAGDRAAETRGYLIRPGSEDLSFTPATCRAFTQTVRWSNVNVNEVEAMDGDLDLDCTLPSGEHLTGRASFTRCS